MKRVFVLCSLLLFAVSLQADPIAYNINFALDVGQQAPTGVFTYDALTSNFTSFQLTYMGIPFAGAWMANNPQFGNSIRLTPVPTLSCLDGKTGGAATFAFLNGDCSQMITKWTLSGFQYDNFIFQIFADDGYGNSVSLTQWVLRQYDLQPIPGGRGSWTISPISNALTAESVESVPEPSTLLLLSLGLIMAAVVFLVYRRPGRVETGAQ